MNAVKNTYDINRVKLYDAVPLDTPFQFCIEPTFLCNLRCNYCMHSAPGETIERQGFKFDSMKWEIFERILSQLSEFPNKVKKTTFSGFGEPLLDERLPAMVRMIKEKDVTEKVLIISNGLLLTPQLWKKLLDAGLDEIKISLQGLTADKYKNICGADVDVDRFYETLEYIYNSRGNCVIRLKIADSALEPGEDTVFYDKFGSICDYIAVEHIYEQFNFVDYNGRLQTNFGKNRFGYEFKPVSVCSTLFFKLNVLQDGKITFGYPDGVTFDGFNVTDTTLYKVWNSQERLRFLVDNLKGDYSRREECKRCTRWAYSVVPEDLLDGHEAEILSRMPKPGNDTPLPPNILCKNIAC